MAETLWIIPTETPRGRKAAKTVMKTQTAKLDNINGACDEAFPKAETITSELLITEATGDCGFIYSANVRDDLPRKAGGRGAGKEGVE